MKFDGNIAFDILNKMPLFLDYEVLVSTPGVAEPDSGFMWGTNFRAPVGISVENEEVSFNLFLPAGSENDKNILLFFNRVGAKFQDGLWQVRRNLGDMSSVYAGVIKTVVSTFPSVILDYSYIEEGRYYAHFLFNSGELSNISDALIAFIRLIPGYRIEYLGKLEYPSATFERVSEIDETITAVLELTGNDGDGDDSGEDFFFVMANYNDGGVKVVGSSGNSERRLKVPKLMNAKNTLEVSDRICTLKCQNEVITSLLKFARQNYLVIASIYGVARNDSGHILVTMPSVQMPVFLNILSEVTESLDKWKLTIKEVSKLRSAMH